MKASEQRAESFMERHDVEGATELDALEALHPGELNRILEREIERYYDDTLEDQIEDAVSDVQAELDRINGAKAVIAASTFSCSFSNSAIASASRRGAGGFTESRPRPNRQIG